MRLRTVAVILLLTLGIAVTVPPRARAGDSFADPLLLSAIISGAVGAVTLLAILLTNHDDPEFFALRAVPENRLSPRQSLRFGPQCRSTDIGPPVACW